MRALLDTHVVLFALLTPERVGPEARRWMCNPEAEVYWSIASSWEVAVKVAKGGLVLPGPIEVALPAAISRGGYRLLPIEHHHVLSVAQLPHHHGDPFDRLLIAQALAEGLAVVTRNPQFAAYGVKVVW